MITSLNWYLEGIENDLIRRAYRTLQKIEHAKFYKKNEVPKDWVQSDLKRAILQTYDINPSRFFKVHYFENKDFDPLEYDADIRRTYEMPHFVERDISRKQIESYASKFPDTFFEKFIDLKNYFTDCSMKDNFSILFEFPLNEIGIDSNHPLYSWQAARYVILKMNEFDPIDFDEFEKKAEELFAKL